VQDSWEFCEGRFGLRVAEEVIGRTARRSPTTETSTREPESAGTARHGTVA
jgi:hypothetical protein